MKTLLLLETHLPKVFSDVNMFVTAVVCALGFLLLAILISTMIKNEPGSNPKDPKKRRAWFWILGVAAVILVFVLLFFVIPVSVERVTSGDLGKFNPNQIRTYEKQMAHYTMMAWIATGSCLVVYVILGIILSKIFKAKKIGDWF